MLVLGVILSRAIGSGVGTGGSPEDWIEGPEHTHGASALLSLTCDIPFNVCCLSLKELIKLIISLSDHSPPILSESVRTHHNRLVMIREWIEE